MSYDVYLEGPPEKLNCYCQDCGHKHEAEHREVFFSRNHTSNTSGMWDGAGAQLRDWHGKRAGDVMDALGNAIADIEGRKEHYKTMEPSNGWGSVESTLEFLRAILGACRVDPDATMRISR
jgi:hypothetical protein